MMQNSSIGKCQEGDQNTNKFKIWTLLIYPEENSVQIISRIAFDEWQMAKWSICQNSTENLFK